MGRFPLSKNQTFNFQVALWTILAFLCFSAPPLSKAPSSSIVTFQQGEVDTGSVSQLKVDSKKNESRPFKKRIRFFSSKKLKSNSRLLASHHWQSPKQFNKPNQRSVHLGKFHYFISNTLYSPSPDVFQILPLLI